jgi:hypothetical protein
MRKHSRTILLAEEQLIFGRSLPEMVVARDNLRSVMPESLLLELLERNPITSGRTRPRRSNWRTRAA